MSKAVFERCGGKNIRLLTALVAGEATGSMTMTIEADDFAASGAVLDKFFADPEGAAMGAAIGTSASPITPPQSTLWVDVPL
jgi:hypothetical protein